MFKILFFLALDAFFIYMLVLFGGEMGNYIFIPILFIAIFTYELICAIKNRFG